MKSGWLFVSIFVVGCAPRHELTYPVGTSGATEPMRAEPEPVVVGERQEVVDPEIEEAEDAARPVREAKGDERYKPVQGLAIPYRSRVRSSRPGATAGGVPDAPTGTRRMPPALMNREIPAGLPAPPSTDGPADGGDDSGGE